LEFLTPKPAENGLKYWCQDETRIGFKIFLDQLAEKYPTHLNVIQLDNGKFHHSSSLKIPENILLIFQPPYTPNLNPIERIWSNIKQEISWKSLKI
jgi:putative transposase